MREPWKPLTEGSVSTLDLLEPDLSKRLSWRPSELTTKGKNNMADHDFFARSPKKSKPKVKTVKKVDFNKRLRDFKFTTDEVEVLISEATSKLKLINSCSNAVRKEIWNSIAADVNKASKNQYFRTGEQCKIRFCKERGDAKKKASVFSKECLKTGGGKPKPSLTDQEELLIATIPKVLLEGIPGGVDTSCPRVEIQENLSTSTISTTHTASPSSSNMIVTSPATPCKIASTASSKLEHNKRFKSQEVYLVTSENSEAAATALNFEIPTSIVVDIVSDVYAEFQNSPCDVSMTTPYQSQNYNVSSPQNICEMGVQCDITDKSVLFNQQERIIAKLDVLSESLVKIASSLSTAVDLLRK